MDKVLPPNSGDLLDTLHAMLTKAGIPDDAFIGGARLTDSGYQKVAKRLGVGPDQVELLMRSLATRLREDRQRVSEMEEAFSEAVDPIVRFEKPGERSPRFAYEVDVMKNVTIHDTETGKKAFVRGTAASAILNKISAGGNEQQILAQYSGLMEAGGWTRAMNKEDEDQSREAPHMAALEKTGFYGKQGAGCVVLAQSTGRLLLAHRSGEVLEPHTWGGWGGAIDEGEDPQESATREVFEEAGYRGEIIAVEPLLVFQKGSFRYHNFLCVVPDEFEPHLNWESQGSEWCEIGDWPTPLHPGLKALFADAASMEKIRFSIEEADKVEESLDDVMESLRQMGALIEAKVEEDSFHDEIHASHGAYNFPWKVDGQHGYATARYKGRGKDMKISILSIRDSEGDQVEANEHLTQVVHEQAIAFIGQE